jgi:isoleucyl-tRNA synthetase
LGKREGLSAVCPVDEEGRFTAEVPDYEGREVKSADPDIIRGLKDRGQLVHRGNIVHSYPHCWRCETPLIYRAISTWFVRVERIKEGMLANNRGVHWVPEHLRDGRFGKWLEQARDWAVSRNRFWGTPLPVWRSEDGSEVVCIGSVEELERRSGRKIGDLHKHFVDDIVLKGEDGKTELRRVPEVLDCWFESGAMPYAQSHYPFENKEHFESHFPADFIAEGLDQTRGWFYTLTVLSSGLLDRAAFRNVVVNGLVLAEDGRKMSKRLKNYPDPTTLLDTYGADALRLYLINSPVVRAEDLCFGEDGVKQSLRHLLLPWWNAYSFLVTYARIDGWDPETAVGEKGRGAADSPNLLDRWIYSSLEKLKEDVVEAMDGYDLQRAVRPFVHFIEDLTNWYIRRSRRRFWKSSDDQDKQQAYRTLYGVLLDLCKVAAPFVPFISEAIYRNLRTGDMPDSVHLCDFPVSTGAGRDLDLESQMESVIAVVGMGRTLRTEYNLKVRQPLMGVHVVCRDARTLAQVEVLKDLVADELNVRNVWFSQDDAELASLSAKANFRHLGPRFGQNVKQVAGLLAKLDPGELRSLADGDAVQIEVDGVAHAIGPGDVVLERAPKPGLAVKSQGALVVALEVDLTQELAREGLARELVNKVQNLRKTADLDVVQRIRITLAGDEDVREAVLEHDAYIRNETLCLGLDIVDTAPGAAETLDLNGHPCRVLMEMAGEA